MCTIVPPVSAYTAECALARASTAMEGNCQHQVRINIPSRADSQLGAAKEPATWLSHLYSLMVLRQSKHAETPDINPFSGPLIACCSSAMQVPISW